MDFIFVKSKKTDNGNYGNVYARIRTNGNYKKYTIGLVIKATEWTKYYSGRYAANGVMTSIGVKYEEFAIMLTRIKTALENDFDPDTAPDVIRSIKTQMLNCEPSVAEPAWQKKTCALPFVDYIGKYIEDLQNGIRLKRGTARPVSTGYVNKIVALKNNLSIYETEKHRTLVIDDITMDFQRDYLKWNRDRGIRGNTIASMLSNIRTIMLSAFEAKLTSADDFRRSNFVPKWEEVDNIYLTTGQVAEMYEADIFTTEKAKMRIGELRLEKKEKDELLGYCTKARIRKLELVRDIFIVGCLCGQRISDYSRISRNMIITIDNNQFISLVQEKTRKKIIFPMDSRIAIILGKYDGRFPKITEQDFNKHIKILAKMLGWTHKANIDKERIGGRIGDRFCDMISSHTARRTFATNAYAAGIPLGSIMAVTGHSSEKTLRRYLKLQVEEKALVAAKDFKGFIK